MPESNSSNSLIEWLSPELLAEIIPQIRANGEDPENLSQLEWLYYLPRPIRLAFVASLPPERAKAIRTEWGWIGRPQQFAPSGDWRTFLILAGRGWGKSRTGAEWVHKQVAAGKRRIALAGPTAADVRDVMVEGASGVLASGDQNNRPRYEPSKRRLTWPNGAIATTFSADEPERFRGPNHDAFWADELASWRRPEAWDQLMFGLRLGDDPRGIVTTTPKPTKIIRDLIASPSTVVIRGSSYENRKNLAPAFFDQIVKKYEGTRLGRQELQAEILDDYPGALWTRDLIEELRWPSQKPMPTMSRIVVAIDPAVSHGEDSDETGIIVAGRDHQGRGYVLDDRSGRYAPIEWAREAIALYRKWDADRIVAEINNGGDMVEATIRMVDENVSFNAVRASRGKIVRAEPVAALYEQRRCHHCGTFPELEDQMCMFVSDWDRQASGFSPDRVDSLTWAMTELLVEPMPSFAAYELMREAAERTIEEQKRREEERRPKIVPAEGSMEYMELLKEMNRPR